MTRWVCLLSFGLGAGVCFAASGDAGASEFPHAMTITGCANVYAVTDGVLSGGAPEGEAAFKALADAGVKTIISVDGAKPDVDGAAKCGLRYVHLPFGYDGVPRERALEISCAIHDLPGKVYIHCHHGKHRSPAAVGAAMVCSQGWTGQRATEYMKRAGSSPSYTGLYSTVNEMKRADKNELHKADTSFRSVAKLPTFIEMMVEVDHLFEALTKSRESHWQPPAQSPDVVPANVALQIVELFRESRRTGQSGHTEVDFNDWLEQAELGAAKIEKGVKGRLPEIAEAGYADLEKSCKSCHEKCRNILQNK